MQEWNREKNSKCNKRGANADQEEQNKDKNHKNSRNDKPGDKELLNIGKQDGIWGQWKKASLENTKQPKKAQ